MGEIMPCHMCNNARVDDTLTDKNDLSYHDVGSADRRHRIIIRSGGGRPLEIDFEYNSQGIWGLKGFYRPKYCPNCGRKIYEYEKEATQ